MRRVKYVHRQRRFALNHCDTFPVVQFVQPPTRQRYAIAAFDGYSGLVAHNAGHDRGEGQHNNQDLEKVPVEILVLFVQSQL